MRRQRFRQLATALKWLAVPTIVLLMLLLGDFITEGGNPMLATLVMLPSFLLILVLVFTRCASCGKSLGRISAHRNFKAQPDPRSLDTCPACGEPFFEEPV